MCNEFMYETAFMCLIDGVEYEFHKRWVSGVPLRAGDFLWIDGLEEVLVERVAWYLDKDDEAYVYLEDQKLIGKASDWTCLLECMDYSIPELPVCGGDSGPPEKPSIDVWR